jgi:hypothetical protein
MVNVLEEGFVTGTKIVQPRFSIGRLNKPVTGTFTIAGKLYFALQAVLRQGVLLRVSELSLLVRRDQLYQVLFFDIAQKKVWLDKMIARIQVAVMFQRQGIATGLGEDA